MQSAGPPRVLAQAGADLQNPPRPPPLRWPGVQAQRPARSIGATAWRASTSTVTKASCWRSKSALRNQKSLWVATAPVRFAPPARASRGAMRASTLRAAFTRWKTWGPPTARSAPGSASIPTSRCSWKTTRFLPAASLSCAWPLTTRISPAPTASWSMSRCRLRRLHRLHRRRLRHPRRKACLGQFRLRQWGPGLSRRPRRFRHLRHLRHLGRPRSRRLRRLPPWRPWRSRPRRPGRGQSLCRRLWPRRCLPRRLRRPCRGWAGRSRWPRRHRLRRLHLHLRLRRFRRHRHRLRRLLHRRRLRWLP